MGLSHLLAGLGAAALVGIVPVAMRETTPVGAPVPATAARASCSLAHPELASGFSLTGWFDELPGRPPDFSVLAELRARGMRHVRLPIGAETVMARFSGHAAVEARIGRIEAAIDALTTAGYAVVVDLHGGDKLEALFKRNPIGARQAVTHAWMRLGPVVEARVGRKVMAEILNEPPVDDATWGVMQAEIVAEVRRVMPTATLVVSTGGPQRVEHLTAAEPIADPNTVYAVHYYDPMAFTHQGAAWLKPDPIGWLHTVPYPVVLEDPHLKTLEKAFRASGPERVAGYVEMLLHHSFGDADVGRDIAALARWSAAKRRPVVLGEFGVYRDAVEPAARQRWLRAVSAAAVEHCIGWTHWEFRDGFGLMDDATGRPDAATLAALAGLDGSARKVAR